MKSAARFTLEAERQLLELAQQSSAGAYDATDFAEIMAFLACQQYDILASLKQEQRYEDAAKDEPTYTAYILALSGSMRLRLTVDRTAYPPIYTGEGLEIVAD